MKKIIFLLFLIFFFLAIKTANHGIRLSDTNIYFNIAYQIFHEKVLYKDIFFSNFPFFSYVASLYYFLRGKNIEFFYFTSVIEIAIIILLIYIITISGIFIAMAIFTKSYFLPIFLSFFIYIAIKKEWKNLLKLGISFTITGLIILLPFLIQAPQQLISDIFGFSLTRPAGLSKINIIFFFITKDLPLFILLIFNILNIRKNVFFGLISIFSAVFFFGYQDIYYLYLNFFIPFLCLSFYEIYYFFKKTFSLQRLMIPIIVSVFIFLNLLTYISSYKNLGKLENFDKIIATIVSEKPKFLYGINDITPALIALTGIPALENVNDAHEYFFSRKIYDKKVLTDKAVENRTIVITHGADYPQYNIKQDILDNIFIKETIYENCKNILSVPILSEGDTSRINLFKCY